MFREGQRRTTALLLALGVVYGLVSCSTVRIGSWSKAQNYFADEEYREAIAESERLLRYGTASPEERASVYLLQARSHEKLGERNEALGLYKYVYDTFPDTPQSYQAKEAISALERKQATSPPLPAGGEKAKE